VAQRPLTKSPRTRYPGEYRIWAAMIERCENPRAAAFKYYGGRGVKVCRRWRSSFAAFITDLGPRPPGRTKSGKRPMFTLERMNSNKNYTPTNCCWATYTQQRQSQRPYDESARVRSAWKTRSRVANNRDDLTGCRFGRLIALQYSGKRMWLCLCDCGTRKDVAAGALKSKATKSCGCLNREVARSNAIARNTPELARKGWMTRRHSDGGKTWHNGH
jgi:hypothetical protein